MDFLKSITTLRLAITAAVLSATLSARATANWYSFAWTNCIAVTINAAEVAGPLTNFPVLINVTNSVLEQYAQTNGNDILFTDASGTNKLAHEVESYISSNGLLVAWVNVPFLSATTNTTLYLYFGNSTATNQQNAAAVWDSNYKGVWHLQQVPTGSTGDLADSTGNHNDGTSQTIAAGAQVAGKISGSLTLNGISNYISTTTSFTNPTTVMVQAWVKTTSTNGTKVVGFESDQFQTNTTQSTSYDRQIYVGTDGKARFGTYNATTSSVNLATSTNAVNDGQWHFLVGCRDNVASNVLLYVDGVIQQTTASSAGQSYTGWYRIGSYAMYSGNWPSGAYGYFAGSVDEIRVSHTNRGSAWIATEFNNQGSPATFYSLGSAQSVPPTQLAITSVNGGISPTVGAPFSVVVQAQDAGGTARNVSADTTVSLSLNTGSGTLGGTLTGTLTNGTSSVAITDVTYSKAENGVVLTARSTGGLNLTAGNSSSFNVSKATVTISSGLTANNRVYNSTTTATISSNNVVLAGVLAGDTNNVALSTNGYTANFATAGVGTNKIVTVNGLTLSGSAATNYTLTQPNLIANITAATVTMPVSSSANPSPTGSNVTFTAALTAMEPGGGTPTGTVQFLGDGTPLGSPATLTNGIASLRANSLSHGTHIITAQYAGDGNFIGSTNSLSPNQTIDSAPVAATIYLQRYPTSGVKIQTPTLLASDSDPDNDPLTFISVSATSAAGGPVVVYTNWVIYEPPPGFTNSDSFSYVIADSYGLQATGSVSVSITNDLAQSQNIVSVTNLGSNASSIQFLGIVGRPYTVQYATNLGTPSWQSLGTATADASGSFIFTDTPTNSLPARFYRSTYP